MVQNGSEATINMTQPFIQAVREPKGFVNAAEGV